VSYHHQRRLDRALYHLENLKADVGAWAEGHPYRTWSDFDVDNRYKVTYLEVLDQPPAHLSLIIGDCIHNLRAALDNLALELAAAHMGARLTKSIAEDSGFPIFATNRADTPKELHKRLRGVDPRAKAIIEGLQPYERKNKFRGDYLWQLHWLDIEDKHRLPHIVLFAQSGSSLFVPDNLSGDDIQFFWDPIENRAPIARYPAFDKTGAEVDVHITPRLSVAFGQRVPQEFRTMPVPLRLAAIHDHIVRKVLEPLRPFLVPP
jgi:hypothetical protein